MARDPEPSPSTPKRSTGLRVLGLLGKLVALAGTAALTFQFGPTGLAAGLLGGFVIPWFISLRPKRPPRRNPYRTGVRTLRWWPQVRPWAIVSGLLAGLGTTMVLQQYSIEAMTNTLLIRGALGGLVGGILIPSIIWAFVVRRVNRAARRPAVSPAVALVMIGGWLIFGVAGVALAEVEGACGAVFVAGDLPVDVAQLNSQDEALAVPVYPDSTVTFLLQAAVPATSSSFELHYGPFSAPIGEGEEGDSLEANAVVDDYDWMGAGLYRLTGEGILSDGTSCVGSLLIDVQVDPLDTVAGATAVTFAAVGTLGVLGVALGNASDATKSLRMAKAAAGAGEAPGAGVAAGAAAGAGIGMADAGRDLATEPSPPPPPPPHGGDDPSPPDVPPWPITAAPEAATGPARPDQGFTRDEAGIAIAAGAGLVGATGARGPADAEDDVDIEDGGRLSMRQEGVREEISGTGEGGEGAGTQSGTSADADSAAGRAGETGPRGHDGSLGGSPDAGDGLQPGRGQAATDGLQPGTGASAETGGGIEPGTGDVSVDAGLGSGTGDVTVDAGGLEPGTGAASLDADGLTRGTAEVTTDPGAVEPGTGDVSVDRGAGADAGAPPRPAQADTEALPESGDRPSTGEGPDSGSGDTTGADRGAGPQAAPAPETAGAERGPFSARDELLERAVDADAFEHDMAVAPGKDEDESEGDPPDQDEGEPRDRA